MLLRFFANRMATEESVEAVKVPKLSGLFTVHFFGSVQMVMVSKNHGRKWFAVMVFTLSRLEHG